MHNDDMGGSPLAALIGAAMEERSRPRRRHPEMIPEAAVMELREYAKNYDVCPFKIGDLITPRGLTAYGNVGKPHLVVEVAVMPLRVFNYSDLQDTAACQFGAKLDLRVLTFHPKNGVIAPFWVESWQFEPWTETKAAAARSNETGLSPATSSAAVEEAVAA